MPDASSYGAAQARALMAVGRQPEAILILQSAIGRSPEDAELHCLLAECLWNLGRATEGADAARSAIALSPEAEWPHRLYSLTLRELGKRREALIEAREAVRLAPAKPLVHCLLGTIQLEVRKFDDAARSAQQAVRLAPHSVEGHLLMADIARGRRHWKEAEALYLRALAIDPDNPAAVNNYALVLKHLGRKRQALDTFENAARLNPRDEIPQANLFRQARDFMINRPLYAVLGVVTLLVLLLLNTSLRARWNAGDPLLVGGLYVYLAIMLSVTFISERRRKAKLSRTTQAFLESHRRRLLGKGIYRYLYFMIALVSIVVGTVAYAATDTAAYVFGGILLAMAWVVAWPVLWRRKIRDWAESRGWG